MAREDHVVAGSRRNKLQSAMAKVLPQTMTAKVHGAMAEPGGASSSDGDDDRDYRTRPPRGPA